MGETAEPAARPRWRWLVWLFAALGAAAAIAIVSLAIMLNGMFGSREPALVAPAEAGGELLEVGNVHQLAGTGLVAIYIHAVHKRGIKGSSGYTDSNMRNLLLLDRATGMSRRVLPDNVTRIDDIEYFPAIADGGRADFRKAMDVTDGIDRDAPPAYYMLTIERRLQNGHSVYDLLVGTIATGRQGIVMRGLSGVEQSSMLDATRLGLVVREGTSLYYRVIDFSALKTVESHKIEIG